MIRVQVCGVRTLEEALFCEEAGADALGFVTVEGRKRNVPLHEIKQIREQLGPFIKVALIGFPATAGEMIEKASSTGADVVQLHSLGVSEIEELKQQGLTAIRAISIDLKTGKAEMSLEKIGEIAQAADLVLFEPSVRGVTGGLGISYDYAKVLSPYLKVCKRFGIGGGLTPENVGQALELKPYSINVSSGVESESGEKNVGKVRAFVKRCKNEE